MATQTHKVDGRPSIQWYWDDWMTDWPLRRCSAFDRGIWMDMLALMWSAPRRGYLETKSGKIGPTALAKISGESEADVKQSLSRLEAEHVFSKDGEGTIYCRRMVRDEKQRISKAEAGRVGGKVSRKKAKGGPSTPSPSPTPTPPPKEGGEDLENKDNDKSLSDDDIETHIAIENLTYARGAYSEDRIKAAWEATLERRDKGEITGTIQSCFVWALKEGKKASVTPQNEKLSRPCPYCVHKARPEMEGCSLCGGSGSLYLSNEEYEKLPKETPQEPGDRTPRGKGKIPIM